MCGLPASGKSTYVNQFLHGYMIVSRDRIVEYLGSVSGLTYDVAFKEYADSVDELLAIIVREANYYPRIVYDMTHMNVKSRKRVFDRHKGNGYKFTCVVFTPPQYDSNEYHQLIKNGKLRVGKNIPNHVYESMIKSYVAPSMDEGFDEIIEVSLLTP